jgi:hypothetical protein
MKLLGLRIGRPIKQPPLLVEELPIRFVMMVEDPHNEGKNLLVGPFESEEECSDFVLGEAWSSGTFFGQSVGLLSRAEYRIYIESA